MKTMKMTFAAAVAALCMTASGAKMSRSVPKGWIEDFEAAKTQAAKEGKMILVAFSGSDWCGWCVKMEKEVYGQKLFVRAASEKYVLVMIDNPRDEGILSKLAAKQNRELTKKYGIRGVPSTLIVDPEGNEVKRRGGYNAGGPAAFMNVLDEMTKGVKWPEKAAAAKPAAGAKKPAEKAPAAEKKTAGAR